MPGKKRKTSEDGEVAQVQKQEGERAKIWGQYFAHLVEEWRAADQSRLFISERKLARVIGIDPTSVNSWSKGQSYASRDACVRVAQWSGHEILEVCEAAGWNPKEDGGYQTVASIIDEVRASDWPEAQKKDIIAKLELTVNPNFMFHPVGVTWAEYIRAVFNQRIPKLAKAERAAHFVELAQADIAKSGIPVTSPNYHPYILPDDREHH